MSRNSLIVPRTSTATIADVTVFVDHDGLEHGSCDESLNSPASLIISLWSRVATQRRIAADMMDNSSGPQEQPLSAFPQTPEQFETDPRVSFSRLDQKWILEADDGSEFEYDEKLKRWCPSVRVLHLNLHRRQLRMNVGGAHGCGSEILIQTSSPDRLDG